ncbi:mitochondrion protein [Wallemia mellicola]|uniref:Probable electron transfer flavoprotein subunit beta n=1 Tax=Wallemia mellicola TaxID=1708541 RepID=A0AB74KBC6_9BASI|nr:mitochondrion protein [Wallemia mellicola]
MFVSRVNAIRASRKVDINVLVPIKRCIDYAVKVRVSPDGKGVDNTVKHSMNPFDEIAVEEAIRLREKNKSLVDSITAITIGPQKAQDTLRTALAMGADKAIHVQAEHNVEPLQVAKTLKHFIDRDKFELVLMGKQAIDGDENATGQMLAGLLDCGQATFASSLKVADGKGNVTREIDGGLETVEGNLPMIVTTDLRLNEPRYASLPNIMKAKKKPIENVKESDLPVDLKNRLETIKVTEPAQRTGGQKVDSVDELVEKLKQNALI